MKKYLTHSIKKSLKERKEYYLYDVPVFILNSLPEHININNVLEEHNMTLLTEETPPEPYKG